ncbi:MAG: putative amidohydrolase [Paenibacillaceae bacterium]|nr:putative amidohydrolase [Paenibacillaceae bacterium]
MSDSGNAIPNFNFNSGVPGGLPDDWTLSSPRPASAPRFTLVEEAGKKALAICGSGDENGVGTLVARVVVEGGQTYRLSVRFRAPAEVIPTQHLLFSFFVGRTFNEGIFDFRQVGEGEFAGDNVFFVPGDGPLEAEVRIGCKFMTAGAVLIRKIGLEPVDPLPERLVRIACFEGWTADIAAWERALDAAAEHGADLALLPETFTGDDVMRTQQPIDGECGRLMTYKARQHRMYVAGTFFHRDEADGCLYNTGLLFDRQGDRAGRYDKFHPFSPELWEKGVTPGTEVPVFDTDFGRIGMMICYDSWFTDIAELVALKGAEFILFPNADYYRSLMPARANDNGVRIVCSSMYGTSGIWDTSGADVERPDADPSRHANNDRTFKEVIRKRIDGIEGIGLLLATLDLNQSPSAHNWGGPMRSAPGGRRNRREQKRLLYEDIQSQINKR